MGLHRFYYISRCHVCCSVVGQIFWQEKDENKSRLRLRNRSRFDFFNDVVNCTRHTWRQIVLG